MAALALLAGVLASLAKIMPTAERLGDLLYELYSEARKRNNQATAGALADSDTAAIAAARAGVSGDAPAGSAAADAGAHQGQDGRSDPTPRV